MTWKSFKNSSIKKGLILIFKLKSLQGNFITVSVEPWVKHIPQERRKGGAEGANTPSNL